MIVIQKLNLTKIKAYSVAALLIILLSLYFFSHNARLYQSDIAKIKSSTITSTQMKEYNGIKETYLFQSLEAQLLNGAHEGETILLTNQYSKSGVYDEAYQKGDQIFVDLYEKEGLIHGRISGLKRDAYLVLPFLLLILLLLFVIAKKGFFTLLSLVINITLFLFALEAYEKGISLIGVSLILMFLFTTISLLLVSGCNKKTFIAILSTLLTLGIFTGIFLLTLRFSEGFDYAFMEYIVRPENLYDIFLAQMLIGGLGATMDISISEAALLSELLQKNPSITKKDLFVSAKELGHDIMGTMINVMLYTYISGSLPMIVLKMKVNIRLETIVAHHIQLELLRFVSGSIVLLMAIPISSVLSILLFKGGKKYAD